MQHIRAPRPVAIDGGRNVGLVPVDLVILRNQVLVRQDRLELAADIGEVPRDVVEQVLRTSKLTGRRTPPVYKSSTALIRFSQMRCIFWIRPEGADRAKA